MTDILEDLKALASRHEPIDPMKECECSNCVTADRAVDEIRALRAEVEAYKRAKQENDERFMLGRDEARAEVETLKQTAASNLTVTLAREVELRDEVDGLKAEVRQVRYDLGEEIERADAQMHERNAYYTELMDARDEVERLRALVEEFPDHVCLTKTQFNLLLSRIGKWRSLARRRREQVRRERAFRKLERSSEAMLRKAVLGAQDDLTIAHVECAKVRAQLEEANRRADLNAKRVDNMRESGTKYSPAAWDRLVAERDAAIRERDEAREAAETLHLDLAQCTVERDEARAEAVDLEKRDERLHEAGEMVFEMARQQTYLRVERDRARELLESTRAQAESHLQARLRAEEREQQHLQAVDEIIDEHEATKRLVALTQAAGRRNAELLESLVCAANWELGRAAEVLADETRFFKDQIQVLEDNLKWAEEQIEGYRGAY